jgi:tripartite-type tricarboxylate transporter receptor subunit TctC
MRACFTIVGAAALLAALTAGPAQAADFYQGKTIKMIVGGSVGGGYDTYSRLLATHLAKHLPGNPGVVVQNMPDGGGLVGANYVYNVAEKDGTAISLIARDALTQPLLGQELAKFDPSKFNWLGTPASYGDNAFALYIRSALPQKSIDDMRKADKPLIFGNRGSVFLPLTQEALGANMKVLESYQGNEVSLAMERSEIDGTGTSYTNVMRQNGDWVSKGFIRVVVQYGHEKRSSLLPDVPTAQELAKSPDDLALIRFAELSLTLGYPYAAPPGVPPERVAMLRKAFDETMQDPEYKAAMQKAGLEYSPNSGPNLANDIAQATKASPGVIARYKKLVGQLGGGT